MNFYLLFMNYYIITGTSRGIGEAIAKALLSKNNMLFCIARNESEALKNLAAEKGALIDQITFDLSNSAGIGTLMENIFQKIDRNRTEKIALINNAGLLAPVKPVHRASDAELIDHLNVNLIGPMLLTSIFIKKVLAWPIPKTIMNISSGAAINPYFGWSPYCSSKAGLNMFAASVGMEQSYEKFPVKVFSVAPGIVETSMQELIRSTDEKDFVYKQKFIELKKQGELADPDVTGKKLADLIFSDQVEQGGFTDLRY